ncbi:MAG: hypothetical protein ACI841_002376 [Planctomycetota bacterium]
MDGIAWDICFDAYRLDQRQGAGAWNSIGTSSYTSTVINDPLGPGSWDSTSAAAGPHDVRVTAFDKCGKQGAELACVQMDRDR